MSDLIVDSVQASYTTVDRQLKQAVSLAVSAKMKGSMFDPGKAPDMLV